MVSFKEQLESDQAVFFNTDEHAETVIYTPAGGDAVEIPAIIDYGENPDDANRNVSVKASATAQVQESDISEPAYQDTITDTYGKEWTVMRILGKFAGDWELELRRDLRPTFRGGNAGNIL